jgi:hypothetical protein
MKNKSENILKYNYMAAYESQSEDMKKSRFLGNGQLILTDTRLAYVKFFTGETLLGLMLGAEYATPDKIVEGLNKKGSFVVPFQEIIELKSGSFMMTPFLLLACRGTAGKHWYKFAPFRKFDALDQSMAKIWVSAIEIARVKSGNSSKAIPSVIDNHHVGKMDNESISDRSRHNIPAPLSSDNPLYKVDNGPDLMVQAQSAKPDSISISVDHICENLPVGAKLSVILTGVSGGEFHITKSPSVLGMVDSEGDIFPDIDLTGDDHGHYISRKHAQVLFHDGVYYLEDLGSFNGTFVNRGPRLIAGQPHELRKGDEIILGRTFLKFED